MHKVSGLIDCKKFIQVKGPFFCFTVDFDALFQFIPNDLGHLIGEHIELRQIGIGILLALVALPVALFLLLVGIGPVIDGIFLEFFAGNRLERRAGQMQRKVAVNVVECHIRLVGIYALVCFVNNQNIPMNVIDFFQLFKFTAKVNGAFEVLQADELDALVVAIVQHVQILIAAHNKRLSLQGACVAHKQIPGIGTEKFFVIGIPRVCNRRAVRHDKDRVCIHPLTKLIGRQRLAEARLCVPEILALGMKAAVIQRFLYGVFLLLAQIIRCGGGQSLQDTTIAAEIIKMVARNRPGHMKPLVFRVVLDAQLAKIAVKVFVSKSIAGAVLKRSVAAPFFLVYHIGSMGLLIQTLVYVLFGIADFRPSVMAGNFRSGIGINHRNNAVRCFDDDFCAHIMPSPLHEIQ